MTHPHDPGEEHVEVTDGDKRLAEELYRGIVESHIGVDDNYAPIHEDFGDAVTRAYKNGDILVRADRLLVAVLWQHVNARSGRATASMVKDLVRGRTALPVDEWLDVPVTAGSLRRTTIRHLSTGDWDRIIESRKRNLDDATSAYADTRRAALIATGLLASHGSMQAAADAGALPLAFKVAS